MTSTPAAAMPFVITFSYNNFPQDPKKILSKCNICITIKDAGLTTSKFIRHLKTQLGESPGNVKVNFSTDGLFASMFRSESAIYR